MDAQQPPIKVLIPGRVFRSDSDATHSPMFHQMEGLVVDKGHHPWRPAGALDTFVQRLAMVHPKIRLRPSYFPLPKPSVRWTSAALVRRQGPQPKSASITAGSRYWAAALSTARLLENCGIDPDVYSGLDIRHWHRAYRYA